LLVVLTHRDPVFSVADNTPSIQRNFPGDPVNELQFAPPAAVEMKSGVMSSVIQWLDDLNGANIHSILVARKGALIFEHYRGGDDERGRQPLGYISHAQDVKHDIRSVTKVVTGLLQV
jgi:hypothetical protein